MRLDDAPLDLQDVMLARGLLSSEGLTRARLVGAQTGERIASIVTRLGFVSEQALADAICQDARLDLASLPDFPNQAFDAPVSARFLRDAKALPLRRVGERVEVAFVDPLDGFTRTAMAFAFDREIAPRVARASELEAALDRLYGPAAPEAAAEDAEADLGDLERLKDLASDAPVVRAVNALITRAAEARASDIHVEPAEDGLKVRFRVDGVLHDEPTLPAAYKAAFVSRVKVMAGLNIAERRLPQDGRLRLAVRGHEIDLRIATSPTIHGEGVVMRLLDRSNLALDFDSLGFDGEGLQRFLAVLRQPHGILLVTGPTGSGKTTTLYAALSVLNGPERKILTIEDPIEYRLSGVNQTQVSPQIGLDFAAALRSFLRQDPDVMMVGEIRDLETAQVSVQAALTGHLVLSTLHTNSAASAVTRLLDMGVEPFLLTSTISGVLAQRLVRRLCPACAEPYAAPAKVLTSIGVDAPGGRELTLFRPKGCAACGGSGFKGRIAILEFLVNDEAVSKRMLAREDARDIQQAAVRGGMRTMLQDGVDKALAGRTTLEEVLRVTRED